MTSSDDSVSGLSEAEAQARLLRLGPNRLPPPQHKTLLASAVAVAQQPMVLLLLACTALYAALGSLTDSALLALSVLAVGALSVYQELRTQHVLEALRDLASPRSLVIRDGIARRISSHELVEGDRLVVNEGDRLACDARLLESHSMLVDESLLTGESEPVMKTVAGDDARSRLLQAGTLVVQGDGVACVTATGERTALGRIGGSIAGLVPRASRLHEQLKRLVQLVAIAALVTCLVAASVFAWREGSWTAGLLVGLTLAMSIVPEEFAVVWAVMLALGAWRLAQLKVLTRQPQAIEALGTTTVLCVDKTGTLTRNRMEVVALHDGQTDWRCQAGPLPEHFEPLLRVAALASNKDALEPMDQALQRLCSEHRLSEPAAQLHHREGVLPGRPFVVHRWIDGAGGIAAMKGAPEAVLALCSEGAERLAGLAATARLWGERGLRVIAVAHAPWQDGLPEPAGGYHAVGLVAFQDPLRDDVPAALAECRAAGVKVIMITGDSPETALAIARLAGLVDDGCDVSVVATGAQLDAMSQAQFVHALAHVFVFARVTPAQKLRIVLGLQQRGEVVAMTGDGVNDGPALSAADIGVAMGERGTDVAREAADLILLDDRFGSLVAAVRSGRRIFVNLRRALGYLFAVHVPIVGVSLLPLVGGPVLLLPLHVVLLELIIDPACSLVFENEPLAADGMRQPPRSANTPLFSPVDVARALTVGGIALLAVLAGQWAAHLAGWSDEALRAGALATVVVGNLLMIQWFRRGAARSRSGNAAFEILVLAVCALAVMVAAIGPFASALGFPSDLDWRWIALGTALPAALAARRLASRRPATASSIEQDQAPTGSSA